MVGGNAKGRDVSRALDVRGEDYGRAPVVVPVVAPVVIPVVMPVVVPVGAGAGASAGWVVSCVAVSDPEQAATAKIAATKAMRFMGFSLCVWKSSRTLLTRTRSVRTWRRES
jgi:hypothetical protein